MSKQLNTTEFTSFIISQLLHELESMFFCVRKSQVLIGRPVLWGLACDGQRGVQHILDILARELDNIMANSGLSKSVDLSVQIQPYSKLSNFRRRIS